MVNFITIFINWLRSVKLPNTPAVSNGVTQTSAPAKVLAPLSSKPSAVSAATAQPAPISVPTPPAPLKFDTVQNSQICVRLLCIKEALTPAQQAELYAVIEAESGFKNDLIHPNRDAKTGELLSTDYGICQVNDFYHIGTGKDFPTVAFVIDNPEAVVTWMIEMYKAGKIDLWSAYQNGSYKKYLPQ